MKKFALLFLIILLSLETNLAQKRPRFPRKTNLTTNGVGREQAALEAAVALEDKAERANALRKFAANYPRSKEINRVSELLVSTLAALADEKMQASETKAGIEIFKQAINSATTPVSDKLFTEVLSQIPNSIFLRGQAAAAVEAARLVEAKAEGNAKQTLVLAGFYLGLENAAEAKRLTEKSLALEPNAAAAYQTLGLAERLNFDFENSVKAYEKSLELAPDAVIAKRNLAEMKRAVGKPAEAVALYREILAKDETDKAAQTGLILALFDDEKKSEAETELQKALAANPNNLPLLVGAAYWYAAHNDAARAVELATNAVSIEPRYTWAHIALARGLMKEKRPLEAERTLLTARQYGNFPTLEYELAAARMQSGFYREAAEGLARVFTIRDGSVATKLGGRVSGEAPSFTELLAAERQASIFEPATADDAENAVRLKTLLDFYQKLAVAPNDETLDAKAAEFIKGEDKMKLHRQLFVAGMLLNKKSDLPKVLELTKAATGEVENGLNVQNPAAAILADELYDSRQLANLRGELILVPDVPRQTLSNILRGRIEDLAGRALLESGKASEAAVRLKRAVSILPPKSSWWRDSQWRLGNALETDGKSKDALEAYVKSYTSGEPDAVKYSVVQSIYRRVNGSTDGLEAQIGAQPASLVSDADAQTEPAPAPAAMPVEQPKPNAAPTTEVSRVNERFSVVTQQFPSAPNAVTKSPTEPAPIVETQVEESKPEEVKTETPKIEEPRPAEPTALEIRKEESVSASPELSATETTPTPTAPIETKIEPAKTEAAKIETPETKVEPTEVKPITKSEEAREKPTNSGEAAPKSIFEPIIITVPKAEVKPAKEVAEETGENRPRVIAADSTPVTSCRIRVNQENASIINDGGVLALIAELVGEGEVKDIKAVSSSPADVEIAFDSTISGTTKRALYVVRSISQKKGVFIVTFETACGKKDVSVSVR